MKKFLSILFATMLAGQAWAYDFRNGGLNYKITNRTEPYTVEVTEDPNYYGNLRNVKIPEKVTYNEIEYAVTSIGEKAFSRSYLTSVTIPNTVTRIGRNAFSYCELTSVTIPNSVTSIGAEAFYNCSKLTSTTIPESVTSIGDYAFYGCSGLTGDEYDNAYYLGNAENPYVVLFKAKSNDITSCEINENCKFVYGSAFSGCNGLTSVTIPESVTSIGNSAFLGCNGLTTITIPNSVKSIGARAFDGCSLKIVFIPISVETIGELAFNSNITFYCERAQKEWTMNLSSDNTSYISWRGIIRRNDTGKNIHWSTKVIGNYAYKMAGDTLPLHLRIFKYIYDSLEVIVPSSVTLNGVEYAITSIGENAFSDCTSLTSITIPESIINIDKKAFNGCDNLDYTLYKGCRYIGNEDNIYYALLGVNSTAVTSVEINSNCKVICGGAFSGCTNLTEVTIPDGVISISNYAFRDCSALVSVTIPNTVTLIDDYAFSGCGELSSVDIPNSVESIGSYAFSGCNGFSSITIPTSVESIGANAFNNCSNITSVTIPNSVTSIGSNAFYNCTNVKTLSYNTNAIGDVFSGKASLESVNIGNDVTAISENAFSGCKKLSSITIPASITNVGKNAFNGCDSLTMIITESNADFRDSNLRFIKDSLGYAVLKKDSVEVVSNSYLNKAVIPSSVSFGNTFAVTGISDNAFKGNGITSVTIPNTIAVIGASAFENCNNLSSVTIPESVKNIGANAFKNCGGLETISINGSAIEIGNGAFSGCSNVKKLSYNTNAIGTHFSDKTNLETLEFGSAVTSISENAFSNCNKLKAVVIPANVAEIGANAFKNNKGQIVCLAETPITLSADPFPNNDTVFVPASCEDTYKAQSVWKRKEILPWCTVTVSSSDETMGTVENVSYCGAGCSTTIKAIPSEGFHFVSWSDDNNEATRKITVTQNITLTATFGAHIAETDTAVAATCIATGLTEGSHCSVCGEVLVAQETIPLIEHTEVTDEAVAATPATTGLTEGSHCSVCGEVLVAQEVVPVVTRFKSGDLYYSVMSKKQPYTASVVKDYEHHYGYEDRIVNLVVPDKVAFGGNEYTVVRIADEAFYESSIQTAVIGDSVLVIGEKAFYYCQNLSSVTIGKSVSFINDNAFQYCGSLTSITIPNSVTFIGTEAFGSSALSSVVLSDSISYISDAMFLHCRNLGSITLPKSVTWIGHDAFGSCGLTSITIPESVTEIGYNAFYGCGGLSSINIPDSVKSIGFQAFYNCGSLKSINIPKTVETIGNKAFLGCKNLTITCEVESKPEGWSETWNPDNRPVVWAEPKPEENNGNEGGENGNENQGGNNEGNENQGGNNEGNENQGGNNEGNENQGGNENNPGTAVAESAADNLQVYAHHNIIIVENAIDEIRVYNAMGALVCRDVARNVSTVAESGRAELQVNGAGVYIVKVGTVAKRVMIND